jgi:uncharacterized membrane protein YbhN (UPF0104 family)
MTVHRVSSLRFAMVAAILAAFGVSPTYAATLNLPLTPTQYLVAEYALGALLIGLLASLLISLARGYRDREAAKSGGSDLRWWKSSQS